MTLYGKQDLSTHFVELKIGGDVNYAEVYVNAKRNSPKTSKRFYPD